MVDGRRDSMFLSEVGKFCAAFAAVVGSAAVLWMVSGAEDAARSTKASERPPATTSGKPTAASGDAMEKGEGGARGGHGFGAEGLRIGVRLPFGAFAFGWQTDRQ
jgi:hypothetical protein